MIKILNHNDIDTHEWQQLVNQSATASYFQTKECYDFYFSLSFLKPFLYGVSENGELKGLVCGYIIADGNRIKRFFSRRVIIPGGILLSKNISEVALEKLLLKVKSEFQKKAIYAEIRNFHDYSNFISVFEKTGFNWQPHLNYQIALTNIDEVFSGISDTRKRQIKQSLREGVVYQQTVDMQDIKDFYLILQHVYRKKVKLPLFPFEFFETVVSKSFGKLLVVKDNNRVLGGILCVGTGNTLYEWFVCGLDKNNTNIYPSVMATWAGIEYAVKNDYKIFDFMGAGKPDKEYGVREFKARFGGKLVKHGRFRHIFNPLFFKLAEKYINLIRQFS